MVFRRFSRYSDKKPQRTSRKMLGRIASANEHKIVLKLAEDVVPYHEGQRIVVSVQNERKTALGKIIKVGEVVAHGKITDISKNAVTIHSKLANPIISKSAIQDNQGEERVILVETIE